MVEISSSSSPSVSADALTSGRARARLIPVGLASYSTGSSSDRWQSGDGTGACTPVLNNGDDSESRTVREKAKM